MMAGFLFRSRHSSDTDAGRFMLPLVSWKCWIYVHDADVQMPACTCCLRLQWLAQRRPMTYAIPPVLLGLGFEFNNSAGFLIQLPPAMALKMYCVQASHTYMHALECTVSHAPNKLLAARGKRLVQHDFVCMVLFGYPEAAVGNVADD